ncbi:MAG TPA: U32 family peptidase [Candidatus Cloacimonetes bacterium]|nr:U32 family peptidase [Candidatus Cloacimonadota bacterium]
MEITAPGGDLEKIQYAIDYGADAVYCGFNLFGLRAAARNLDHDDLLDAIAYAHDNDVQLYLTLNAYLKNQDYPALRDFLSWLKDTDIDAVIVSDPGVFQEVKKHTNIPIHISTQTNVISAQAARFWHEQGAKRIVGARELTFAEMKEIKEELPELELECFIHGAMCIAYSGRCILSAYLNDRSANSGACTQVCRWDWALTEEVRRGEYFPIEEDQYGTHILSSKDISVLNHMPLLAKSGIDAGKIEGRMKSLYYVAQTTRLYKAALNAKDDDHELWELLNRELYRVSHRPYWEGFYGFSEGRSVIEEGQRQDYFSDCAYSGKIIAHEDGMIYFDCLAKVSVGDTISIIQPDPMQDFEVALSKIYDEEKNSVDFTKPNQRYYIDCDIPSSKRGLIRKCVN